MSIEYERLVRLRAVLLRQITLQRAGVLSFGIGPIRIGRNSEGIRHVFQNRFAHDLLTGGKSLWFMQLPISPSWYWSFGTGRGNSLW